MSIASVGGTFGYVDPSTVAGPGRASQVQPDTLDPAADQTVTPSQPAQTSSSSPSAPTPPLTSGQPTFAPATAAKLLKVQETAFASTT